MAAACAFVFVQSTYVEFERVRIGLSDRRSPSPAGYLTINLPDLSRLRDRAAVLIVDLQTETGEPRRFVARLDDTAMGSITLAGRGRLIATVPANVDLVRARTLAVSSDGAGWSVERAQLSNVRGYSFGLVNAVVTPAAARGYERPHPAAGLLVIAFFTLAALTLPWRSALGARAYGAVAALAGCVLLAAALASYQGYRILFAFHTFVFLVALLYLPAVERLAAPLIERVWPVDGGRSVVTIYGIVIVLLAATSAPRLIGDGGEYLAMATAFAEGRWPSPAASDHFWLYSALAAPFVFVTDALYLGALTGFLLLNGVLLISAFAVVSARVPLAVATLLFAGPVVWWIDKPHTEVFTFALLAIAVALLLEKPWWSLLAMGIVAAQNPAVAPLIVLSAAALLAWRMPSVFDRRFWFALMAAAGLALLHPLYFLARTGQAVPLLDPGKPSWPSAERALAVLIDTNVGLFANVPLFAVALVLAVWLALSERAIPRVEGWLSADRAVTLIALPILLFAFAQTENVNHGGTRDMSRYGLWLLPLALPWLRGFFHGGFVAAVPSRLVHESSLTAGVAIASAIWCVVLFHPSRGERYTLPTRLAEFVWTRFPSLTNPLPEIFIERLQGHERTWTLPIATAGCEKALLAGGQQGDVPWPPQCGSHPVPDLCRKAGTLCYANRSSEGYAFETVVLD